MIKKILVFLRNIALLAWFATCMIIFMYFPGAINHMQGAPLYDFSLLPEKLTEIQIAPFLLDILKSFLGVIFFGAACVSLGMRVASFGRLDENLINNIRPRILVLLPTYFLIGNSLFSLIFLALASLWYLSPTHSIVLLSLGLLSGLTKFRNLSIPIPHFNTDHGKVVLVLSALLLVVSALQSSARISYDASAVYFSIAKLTALEQHAGYYLENTFVASVLHSVIPFTAVMQIFGDQSARMITWLFGLVNVAIALAIAEHVGASALARRILLALILTSTAFLDLMGDGKVDLISSAYALGAIYWLIAKDKDTKQVPSQYILSGCFIGFACILRPYNAFLLGVFVFVHLVQKLRTGSISFRGALSQTAWLALGAIGFAAYHLYINNKLLGSPFAFWSSISNINPVDGPWDFDPKTVWIERLLYPIIVTFKNSPSSLGSVTPLVLVFLSVLAIKDIRKRVMISQSLLQLSISAVITLYAWLILFFTIAEIRYVLFLWIIIFIPLAEVGESAFNTENDLIKNSIKWCIILLLGFILFRSTFISISKYAPLDVEGNPQCIGDILCGHLATINEMAGKGERVLTLSAFRYYLRTDLFACSTNAEEYVKLRKLSFTDSEGFWREVYRLGYSYVAFEKDYTTRHLVFSDEPFSNLPDWVKLSPIITTSQNLQIVAYKFTGINPPVNAEIVCRQDDTGIWGLQAH